MISEDTTAATSSPESPDGSWLSLSPDGPPTARSGPGAARASRSASPDRGAVQTTLDISGPPGLGSSASVGLASCLASRLRERLGTDGSMEYSQTWKARTTPVGRSYWEHTASGRRTSGSGCGGWPTPDASVMNDGESMESFEARREALKAKGINGNGAGRPLAIAAQMAGWATPTGQDGTRGSEPPRPHDTGVPLSQQVAQTGKRGALNPAFSRWLMGFGRIWDLTAPAKIAPSASSVIRRQAAALVKHRGESECSEPTGMPSAPESRPNS